MVEAPPALLTRETVPVQEPTRCLFISGMNGNTKGIEGKHGIKESLEGEYGQGNVLTFGSIVSADKPQKDRYKKMADFVMDNARQGRVDLVMHSLGVAEFVYLRREIRRRDKGFFKDETVKKNLRLVKIAESGGLKGMKERVSFLRENKRLLSDLGAEAMYALPVKGVSDADLKKMYPTPDDTSVKYKTVSHPELRRTNDECVIEDERARKDLYDHILPSTIQDGDYVGAALTAKNRATDLKDSLQTVFDANPDGEDRDTGIHLSWRGLATVARALGNKQTRIMRRMYRSGITVDTLRPGIDRVTTLKTAGRIYSSESEQQEHITVVAASPHSGIGLQPGEWARVIKSTGEKKAA